MRLNWKIMLHVLGRKEGFLTIFESRPRDSFKSLISFHDGQSYDQAKELCRLHQLYRYTTDLHMTSFPLHMQEYTQHVMDLLTIEFAPRPRSYQLSIIDSSMLIASTETPCLRVGLVGPGLCQEATAEFQRLAT